MDKNILWLNITMKDRSLMQVAQPMNQPNKCLPYLKLIELLLLLLLGLDEMSQIPSLGKLHDNAEQIQLLLKECLIILDDVAAVEGSQEPDLV